jgi:hypothetical protein
MCLSQNEKIKTNLQQMLACTHLNMGREPCITKCKKNRSTCWRAYTHLSTLAIPFTGVLSYSKLSMDFPKNLGLQTTVCAAESRGLSVPVLGDMLLLLLLLFILYRRPTPDMWLRFFSVCMDAAGVWEHPCCDSAGL